MCGIAGFYLSDDLNAHNYISCLPKMVSMLSHRGPDSSDYIYDKACKVGFAHTRLSIIDTSSAGSQPMESKSGRYIIIFNGEIYNHLDLRIKLDNTSWRGHSDTETILACIEEWGFKKTLMYCVGMFSIALLDKKESRLKLAVDRFGEKPLYYSTYSGNFVFGSELKALKILPGLTLEVNRDVLSMYLRYKYIPAPYCIYKHVNKIEPGKYISIDLKNIKNCLQQETYWSFKETVNTSQNQLIDISSTDFIKDLEDKLTLSVSRQMLSDVPIGSFLSGGIDSSLITTLMQSQSFKPIKTFTMGFADSAYNEAKYAKEISERLGTDHTELYVDSQMAIDIIQDLPKIYDEPFGDSSQIPTTLLSRLTREHVTVALSGDAGDEIFGGYNRHTSVAPLWNNMKYIPSIIRNGLSNNLSKLSPANLDSLYKKYNKFIPNKYQISHFGDQVQKISQILKSKNEYEMYISLISSWDNPDKIVKGSKEIETFLTSNSNYFDLDSFEHTMMAIDTLSYLPGDILTKVDRASMSASLETRLPFLDHNLVEFAWKLPIRSKIKKRTGKLPLREILYKYIDRDVIERPKMGFGIPIDTWLRGPLRDWAENLLNEKRLIKEGFFNPEEIRYVWEEHLSGKKNWQDKIWTILMFQLWLENNS